MEVEHFFLKDGERDKQGKFCVRSGRFMHKSPTFEQTRGEYYS